jgi:NAD(P)-dependent dehydrogenase (short-subunit alcohol dehydrogenase family)
MNEIRKIAVVTGASAGVGKAACRQLLGLGWQVIGVGRDPARCAAAEAELAHPDFTMLRADLSSLAETARVAAEISARVDHVDALLNNAGGVRPEQVFTAEGHDETFAANHLAPFLLTQKLLPLMPRGARVVAVSSTGHLQCQAMNWDDLDYRSDWLSGAAYCQAKLANILFTRELAKRGAAKGIIAHVMHPGVVASNFASHCEPGMKAYMESILDRSVTPDHAAETLVFLASAAEPGRSSGHYWYDKARLEPSAAAQDDAAAERLWSISEQMVAGY